MVIKMKARKTRQFSKKGGTLFQKRANVSKVQTSLNLLNSKAATKNVQRSNLDLATKKGCIFFVGG